VPAAAAFAPIRRIGGPTGWYYANPLWRLRGLIDQLLGGPGLARGRRDPGRISTGDVIDAWRVEAFEPDRLLLLRAEINCWPGVAPLEAEPAPQVVIGRPRLFVPRARHSYWYASCRSTIDLSRHVAGDLLGSPPPRDRFRDHASDH
jgi:hypothetical protein